MRLAVASDLKAIQQECKTLKGLASDSDSQDLTFSDWLEKHIKKPLHHLSFALEQNTWK